MLTTYTPQGKLNNRLRQLGAVMYDLWLPETKALTTVLRPDEKLLGVVYGRYRFGQKKEISRGMLVATDQRVFILNKKPMFTQNDEFAYWVVSGVDYARVGIMGNVTLLTRIGDIHLRTFNRRCAETFVAAIDANIIRN